MMHFYTHADATFALQYSYRIRLKRSPRTNIQLIIIQKFAFICAAITCVDVLDKCTKANENVKIQIKYLFINANMDTPGKVVIVWVSKSKLNISWFSSDTPVSFINKVVSCQRKPEGN